MKLAQPLNHPRVLLWDDAHPFDDEGDEEGRHEYTDGSPWALSHHTRSGGENGGDNHFDKHRNLLAWYDDGCDDFRDSRLHSRVRHTSLRG